MNDKNILKFQMFYFVVLAGLGCFIPYINVYLENNIGLSGSQIGLITMISLVLGVCVAPLWGIIGDKTKKYNLLLLTSLSISIVVLYFYSKQSVYLGVIIFALLLEMARLGTMPMSDTIVMSYCKKNNKNYGSVRGLGSLGYMLGSMAIGFVADQIGLDGPLFTSYMILLGVALLLGFSFPKVERQDASKKEEKEKGIFKQLLSNKKFLFILFVVISTQAIVDSAGAYSGNHLTNTLNAGNSFISMLNMVRVGPEILFLMVASQTLKKLGYKKFILIAAICIAIRLYVYALIPNPYIFVGISVFHCLGVALQTVAALAFIQDVVSPAVFGTSITLLNVAMNLSKAILGFIYGNIYEFLGSDKIFLLGAILVTIAIVVIASSKVLDTEK